MPRAGGSRRTLTATRAAAIVVVLVVAAGCVEAQPGGVTVTPGTTAPGPGGTTAAPADVPDSVYPHLGDPRIDVARYDVSIVTTPRVAAISGTVRMTAKVRTKAPLRSFTLDLRAPMKASVVEVDGLTAGVRVDADQLVIIPAHPLAAGSTFTADVTYAGVPRPLRLTDLPGLDIGWQHDDRGGSFTLSEPVGTHTWMPVSDHPSDKAVFRISVDVPNGVEVVGNGRLVGKVPSPTAGRTVWTWGDPKPMAPYLALVAVGQYQLVQRRAASGLDIVEAYPDGTNQREIDRWDTIEPIVAHFSSAFGPYPFSSTGVIVVPTEVGVALETQTRPTFGEEALAGGPVNVDHEMAHMWFGDSVGLATWRDIWLNEGFASYAEWDWKASIGEGTIAAAARSAYEQLGARTTPLLARTERNEFDPEVYLRGALTLYAVRTAIGTERFGTLMRRWVSTYGGRTATTAQFIALAGTVSGRDLTGLFHAWLEEAAVPAFPR